MGKRFEQPAQQRRNANCEWTHEKMFNMVSYQRNAK